MGLQHAGTDHGEPVEPDLRHEHDQQRGDDLARCRRSRPWRRPVRTARAPASAARPAGVSTSSVQVISADTVWRPPLPPTATDMPGDHRDDHAGQHAAGDDLEQHVRQRVRGVVGIAEAGVADGLGEHQRAAEADDPRGQGQPGHGSARPRPSTGPALPTPRPAQLVQPAQPRRPLDHRGEADPLAGQVQAGDPERGRAAGPAGAARRRRPWPRRRPARSPRSRRASTARPGRSAGCPPPRRRTGARPVADQPQPEERRSPSRPGPGAGRAG